MVSRRLVVVGGGLAGLTAATLAAKAGWEVLQLEKAPTWGGRARSDRRGEAWLNLGPHALFEAGHARRVLRGLGVDPKGGLAPARGTLAARGGVLHAMPVGPVSLLTTDLLGASDKLALARLFGALGAGAPADARGRTLDEWLAARSLPSGVRALLRTVARLSSYASAPDRVEAAATLDQIALGARGVRYLDGGWQRLVDALLSVADGAGVRRRQGVVRGVALEHGRAVGVDLASGERLGADAVVLAIGPRDASSLVPPSAALAAAATAEPVQASCLDLVVEGLARPRVRVVLGIDEPLYLSVHSSVADLVAKPAEVVHVARYLAPGERGDESTRRELLGFAELAHPGIGARLREARFLPHVTVSNALAPRGGLAARPSPLVPDVEGLFVAGDWVGGRGMLADAALASAEECAMLLAACVSPARAA